MEEIIRLENVSKIYKMYESPKDRLKEALHWKGKKYHKDFYALQDINLSVKKGEIIGFLGKNGAGKSTLLKLITGVLTANEGSVNVNGRISALIELGAGFNYEYTGMENIYLYGTLQGKTKEETDRDLQKILDFADIGEFINQPVKTYSSGMFARLAFSVAINVNPDILIVDEILSVGDLRFQIKCMKKMKQMMEQGVTVIFVSHAVEQVKRLCTKALWLENGKEKMYGDAVEICNEYEDFMTNPSLGIISEAKEEINEEKNNDLVAKLLNIEIQKKEINTFDMLKVNIKYEICEENIENFVLGIAIHKPNRDYIFGPNTFLENIEIPKTKGKHEVIYKIPKLPLMAGNYTIDVGLFIDKGLVCLDYKEQVSEFKVKSEYFSEGLVYMKNKWEIVN